MTKTNTRLRGPRQQFGCRVFRRFLSRPRVELQGADSTERPFSLKPITPWRDCPPKRLKFDSFTVGGTESGPEKSRIYSVRVRVVVVLLDGHGDIHHAEQAKDQSLNHAHDDTEPHDGHGDDDEGQTDEEGDHLMVTDHVPR